MTTPRSSDTASLIVFDFDGTIADSMAEVLAAYNQAAAGLGVAPISPTDVGRLRGMRPWDILRELHIPMWKLPLILRAVRQGMRDGIESVRPVPGIDAAVRSLRQAGARCAILSSNSQDNIRRFLVRNAMDEFDLLHSGATIFGKASQLRRLLKGAKGALHQSYYVGDEVRDVVAAREAGVRSAAVSWGYSHRSALQAEQPDVLADTPEQLSALLTPGA